MQTGSEVKEDTPLTSHKIQNLDEPYSWGRESSQSSFMRDLMDDDEEYYRVDEKEREELNAPILEVKDRGLSLTQLRVGLLILGAIVLLFVPKIYLSSSIYYLSKELGSLQTQHDMLYEQNKTLKHNVEDLRYKYMILGE